MSVRVEANRVVLLIIGLSSILISLVFVHIVSSLR